MQNVHIEFICKMLTDSVLSSLEIQYPIVATEAWENIFMFKPLRALGGGYGKVVVNLSLSSV